MILSITKRAALAATLLVLTATSASAATKPFSEIDTEGGAEGEGAGGPGGDGPGGAGGGLEDVGGEGDFPTG